MAGERPILPFIKWGHRPLTSTRGIAAGLSRMLCREHILCGTICGSR
jgi:hypothetical protein